LYALPLPFGKENVDGRAIARPSLQFMAAYQAALANVPVQLPAEIGSSRNEPGTINALIVSYYKTVAKCEAAQTGPRAAPAP
jgi:hypothetical protein